MKIEDRIISMEAIKLDKYEEKICRFIDDNNILAEHLSFKESCHSVEDAARTVDAKPEDFVKNICLIDQDGRLIIAIVKGEDRASTTKVGKILNIERPQPAKPDEILEKTGYICGGVPSFGFKATFLIDPKVMEKEVVFTGGGSVSSLIKISTKELQQANKGKVARIRK